MSFTLFVKLPNEDVCSLRRLPGGCTLRHVRKLLEMTAGLPAHTYDLVCPKGKLFTPDDSVLQLEKDVWEGYVMRAVFRGSWQKVYEAVVSKDVDRVLMLCSSAFKLEYTTDEGEGEKEVNKDKNGSDHDDSDDDGGSGVKTEEDERTEEGRGIVALFIASFLGLADLCKALVCAGVDPDGKTPFGRTPLFAAMSGDHVLVTEVLLSHHAALEARDVDGSTALDVAKEREAKDCLRKVRHMKLFQRVGSATSSITSRTSALGSVVFGPGKTGRHQVFWIPTGTETGDAFSSASSHRVQNQEALSAVRSSCEDVDRFVPPSVNDASSPRAQEARASNGASSSSNPPAVSPPGSRPSPRALFQHGEVYAWDKNLRSVSRASSAAGTQVRIPELGRERVLSAYNHNRASKGHGVSWSDTTTMEISRTGKKCPSVVRLSLQDLSISCPDHVLRVSTSSSHISHAATNLTTSNETSKRCSSQELPSSSSEPETRILIQPHGPAREPPERPPSRDQGEGESRQCVAGSVGGRVPGMEQVCRGGARAVTRHVRSRHRKQQASWRTMMKRRLKLAEDKKRHATPPLPKPSNHNRKTDAADRVSFEQWLERKRQDKERQRANSDDDTSSSSEDRDDEARSAENERAFNNWLRDLKERPLKGPHPYTVASLHRRKSRPLKNLIQVGGDKEDSIPAPDPATYMTAYQDWRRRKRSTESEEVLSSPGDLKTAQKLMEEKQRSFLVTGLTYDDWLEVNEQQRKLTQAMLRAYSSDNINNNNKKQPRKPSRRNTLQPCPATDL